MKEDKNTVAKDVIRFHERAGIVFPTDPTLSSKDEQELSISLITEELEEYKEALKKGDLVETADALGDIITVTVRAICQHGLLSRMPSIMDEISNSNMSKFPSTLWEAQKVVDRYALSGVSCNIYQRSEGEFAVLRTDGKVLKDDGWRPPDIKSILDGKAGENTEKSIRS